jgi:hypothetical protein
MSQFLTSFIRSPISVPSFRPLWVNRQVRGKKRLIDFACENLAIKSFADLGGVWGVDGQYTFYAMDTHKIRSACLVDINFTETVIQKQRAYAGLKIISGNFAEAEVARQIGKVDAIILFDVLLHQVNPDWDAVLELYAGQTKSFLIFNPQFTAADHTVRLLDLGEDEYFRNIPHTRDDEPYKTVLAKMHEIHPRPQYKQQRIFRDIHDIWQWGIVDEDLIFRMKNLGFTMQYFKNWGRFNKLTNFENHAFAFCKE